jgi:hypothetical protein
VRAVVGAVQPVPGQRLVEAHLAARLLQPPQRLAAHPRTADRVEHQPHLDAGTCPLDHHLDQRLADFPRREDVGLQVDRDLGAADGIAHRRVELRPVGEDLDAVAGVNGRLADGLDDAGELVAVGPQRRGHVVVDPRREQQHEDEPDDERDAYDRPEH